RGRAVRRPARRVARRRRRAARARPRRVRRRTSAPVPGARAGVGRVGPVRRPPGRRVAPDGAQRAHAAHARGRDRARVPGRDGLDPARTGGPGALTAARTAAGRGEEGRRGYAREARRATTRLASLPANRRARTPTPAATAANVTADTMPTSSSSRSFGASCPVTLAQTNVTSFCAAQPAANVSATVPTFTARVWSSVSATAILQVRGDGVLRTTVVVPHRPRRACRAAV